MDILFTVSNTVKHFLFYHVNITVYVDIQFPVKKFSVKMVDCIFFMQIPVKRKHQSLCSFCNVNNSQYFETWGPFQ